MIEVLSVLYFHHLSECQVRFQDREATMQQRLRESARSLEKMAEEERQEAERLLAENKKLRVENDALQKQSSEESNDMNAEYKKMEDRMTKQATEVRYTYIYYIADDQAGN